MGLCGVREARAGGKFLVRNYSVPRKNYNEKEISWVGYDVMYKQIIRIYFGIP